MTNVWWSWLLLGIIDAAIMATQIWFTVTVPSYLLFGIYVPQSDRGDPVIQRLRRRYTWQAIAVSLLGLAVGAIAGMVSDGNEGVVIGSTFVIQAAGMALLWSRGRRQALQLKAERQWGAPVQTKRVVDLNFRKRQRLVSNGWFLLQLLLAVACGLIAWLNWDRIPDTLATHFDIDGTADRYSAKTFGSVFTLNIVQVIMIGLFWLINMTIQSASQNLDPERPEESKEQQLRSRRATSIFLYVLSWVVVLLFAAIQGFTLYAWPHSMMMWIGIGAPVVIFVGLAVFIYFITKRGGMDEQAAGMHVKEDRYWRGGGQIYFNKEDPALMVSKRYGMGWTMNFAHPMAWVIFCGILLVPIIIIILSAVAT